VDYRVELDVYNGPLDLLLYLIKRDELDIYDIPITRITETYMSYIGSLKELSTNEGLDINVAGEFLVMAATLLEIKSAMLLPKTAPVEGAVSAAQELSDPRYELIQKLLEYKRFKEAAAALDQRHRLQQERFPRHPAAEQGHSDEPPPLDLEEVQVWDLLTAFTKLMQQVALPRFHEIIYDDTPIDLHAADIADRLSREGALTLRALLEGRRSRSEMIGVFLALLELMRQRRVVAHQADLLGDIVIELAPAEQHMRAAEAETKPPDPAPTENPA
jgi:segregation and condensation protein A